MQNYTIEYDNEEYDVYCNGEYLASFSDKKTAKEFIAECIEDSIEYSAKFA